MTGWRDSRAEFPRRIVAAVRERAGDSVAVLAKLKMDDGVRGGPRPDDSIEFAGRLEADGHLDALVLTGGSFLDTARRFREALSMPLVLLGGVTDRAATDTATREGFDFVAMARALREPDLILRIERDASTQSQCVHCNRCVPTIYSGTQCPLARLA